jgi:hypothetical protein
MNKIYLRPQKWVLKCGEDTKIEVVDKNGNLLNVEKLKFSHDNKECIVIVNDGTVHAVKRGWV